MLGMTHAAVAGATAVTLMHPSTIPVMFVEVVAAVIGGLIPDTDTSSSIGARATRKCVCIVGLQLVFGAILWLGGESEMLTGVLSSFSWKQAGGVLGVILLCVIGMLTPHRSLMHSIPMMILATACMWCFSGALGVAFGIGYASHLALDMFNYKGISLFWPMKKKFCLKLCRSDGVVNTIFFVVCILGILAYAMFLYL